MCVLWTIIPHWVPLSRLAAGLRCLYRASRALFPWSLWWIICVPIFIGACLQIKVKIWVSTSHLSSSTRSLQALSKSLVVSGSARVHSYSSANIATMTTSSVLSHVLYWDNVRLFGDRILRHVWILLLYLTLLTGYHRYSTFDRVRQRVLADVW